MRQSSPKKETRYSSNYKIKKSKLSISMYHYIFNQKLNMQIKDEYPGDKITKSLTVHAL